MALNEGGLADAIKAKEWDSIELFGEKLKEYLRYYLYVGGMPEVVDAFRQTRDWQLVRDIQSRLLASYEGDFSKHAPHDVGLLGAMSGLDVRTIIDGDEIFEEFKGALAEQYVMQQLRVESERYIGYWTNDRNTAEVDFVVQERGKIIPIEVKSGENLKAKSFRLFCEKYHPEVAIRTSLAGYRNEGWMTNVPLYAIM